MERLVIGITGASGVILGIRLLQVVREARSGRDAPRLERGGQSHYRSRDRLEGERRRVAGRRDLRHARRGRGHRQRVVPHGGDGHRPLLGQDAQRRGELVQRRPGGARRRCDAQGRPTVDSRLSRDTAAPGAHQVMERAAEIGAVIMPPVPAFYARPQTIDQVVDNTVGRILLRLGIENELYLRWAGMKSNVKRET